MTSTVQGLDTHVTLYNTNGDEVAKGHVQALEAGDSLEGLVLSPYEEAVFIEEVLLPSQKVHEILLYTMGDYYNQVICWLRELVKKLQRHTNSKDHLPQKESATFFPNCRDNECTPPIKNQKEF
jgi:hypothetical protein